MSIKEVIEKIIEDYNKQGIKISKKEIADYLGISKQNFANKLSRDTFSPEELSMIAEKLDCELIIRNNNDEYKIKYNEKKM